MFREGCHVQKNKRCYEKMHMLFNWCFIIFSSKIDDKSRKNQGKRHWAQKSTKNPRLERSFSPKSKFSIDFWAPSGSIWASRDVPGASQKPLIFNRFSVASANQPGPASGRLQRVAGCHPDTSLAQFCIDFGSILRVDFDIHSFGNALIFRVKCSRFCGFFLHLSFMHVTLMRTKGTLDRWIDT